MGGLKRKESDKDAFVLEALDMLLFIAKSKHDLASELILESLIELLEDDLHNRPVGANPEPQEPAKAVKQVQASQLKQPAQTSSQPAQPVSEKKEVPVQANPSFDSEGVKAKTGQLPSKAQKSETIAATAASGREEVKKTYVFSVATDEANDDFEDKTNRLNPDMDHIDRIASKSRKKKDKEVVDAPNESADAPERDASQEIVRTGGSKARKSKDDKSAKKDVKETKEVKEPKKDAKKDTKEGIATKDAKNDKDAKKEPKEVKEAKEAKETKEVKKEPQPSKEQVVVGGGGKGRAGGEQDWVTESESASDDEAQDDLDDGDLAEDDVSEDAPEEVAEMQESKGKNLEKKDRKGGRDNKKEKGHDHKDHKDLKEVQEEGEAYKRDEAQEQAIEKLLADNADIVGKLTLNRKKRRLILKELRLLDVATRSDLKDILRNVAVQEATEDEKKKMKEKKNRWEEKQREERARADAEDKERRRLLKIKRKEERDRKVAPKKEEYIEIDHFFEESKYQFYYMNNYGLQKDEMGKGTSYMSKKQVVGIDVQHKLYNHVAYANYLMFSSDSKGLIFNLQQSYEDVSFIDLFDKLLADDKILKIGYCLQADLEALSNTFKAKKMTYRNVVSIEDKLFVCKTSTVLNLSKMCYRCFGKYLHPDKLKKLCEKPDLKDYEDRKAIVVDSLACLRLFSELSKYIMDEQVPTNQDLLKDKKVDKSWRFVLDSTCACGVEVMEQQQLQHEVAQEATYKDLEAVSKANNTILITNDRYILNNSIFKNKMCYRGKKEFLKGM